MKGLGISRPALLRQISNDHQKFRQVRSEDRNKWVFELENPAKIPKDWNDELYTLLSEAVSQMNLYVHMGFEDLMYAIPEQSKLPFKLPQISVLYSLLFWLGSLVRYDPHSVLELQDSRYWILIDGFINQSRAWLLELFEWQLYKRETTLKTVR